MVGIENLNKQNKLIPHYILIQIAAVVLHTTKEWKVSYPNITQQNRIVTIHSNIQTSENSHQIPGWTRQEPSGQEVHSQVHPAHDVTIQLDQLGRCQSAELHPLHTGNKQGTNERMINPWSTQYVSCLTGTAQGYSS